MERKYYTYYRGHSIYRRERDIGSSLFLYEFSGVDGVPRLKGYSGLKSIKATKKIIDDQLAGRSFAAIIDNDSQDAVGYCFTNIEGGEFVTYSVTAGGEYLILGHGKITRNKRILKKFMSHDGEFFVKPLS
jgi:hypothetical protein